MKRTRGRADLQELRERLALLRATRKASKSDYKEGKVIAKRLIKEQGKESQLNAQERSLQKQIESKSYSGRIVKGVDRAINNLGRKRMVSRRITRRSPRATIMVNQPVYLKDKSRFFKEQWEEEKRQLFFS